MMAEAMAEEKETAARESAAPESGACEAREEREEAAGEGEPSLPGGMARLRLDEAFHEAREVFNAEAAEVFASAFERAGLYDEKIANALAAEVLSAGKARAEMLYEEAVAAYGGTPEEPGARFVEAVGEAGRALEALERQVPGLRDAIVASGGENDVRLIKAFALVGELVGEDGNLMGGGLARRGRSAADVLFG